MPVIIAFYWVCSDAQWWTDLMHVLAVFFAAGLLIAVLFVAQLCLIHQIERGCFSRRRRSPHGQQ